MEVRKSDFIRAYNKLMEYEGFYSNDPDDTGGETYKGISRVHNPRWEGWKIIDSVKDKNQLKDNKQLEELVKNFYKREYWNFYYLDNIPSPISDEIFECAVNLGRPRCTRIIQTCCNVLNQNQRLYKDIPVDGVYNDLTYKTLMTCLRFNSTRLVFNVLNILQGCEYVRLMLSNTKNEKWVGWFNRVEIIK